MTGAASIPGTITRFGSPKARTAWKACGQSLPALPAGPRSGHGLTTNLSTLSARRRTANVPALRRSDNCGLRGYGPAWPRRQASTAGSAPVRNLKKRSHASGLDRGASNAKPGLDMPGRNCRTIGTLLVSKGTAHRASAVRELRARSRNRRLGGTAAPPCRCQLRRTSAERSPSRNGMLHPWLRTLPASCRAVRSANQL